MTVPRAAVFDTSIFVGQESRGLGPLAEWTPVVSVITLAELMLGVEMSPTGEVRQFRAGIGILAAEMGVPVVPFRIHGLQAVYPVWASWPSRGRVRVVFGEPVTFSSGEDRVAIARRLEEAVRAL